MARTPNLKTLVAKEKKIISMLPGRLSLRPKRTRTVQLGDGQFSTIEDPPLFVETLGERRESMTSREYDLSIPTDAEVVEAVQDLLDRHPWMATDVRYQIQILGEHQARQPWLGYDEQTADQIRGTYENLPESARAGVNLEAAMKYELERTRYDEDLDEEVSVTDDEKVKALNELYRISQKEVAVESTDTVSLD